MAVLRRGNRVAPRVSQSILDHSVEIRKHITRVMHAGFQHSLLAAALAY